jgi:apolipoprotein N-acyltransferase
MEQYRFAVTICWENLFPQMPRQFVRNGAQFIINITNEAWFGKVAAPQQFVSMNVFRAVENGVYVVRCANTGISCIIDPCGRIANKLTNKSGETTFVDGYMIGEVTPIDTKTVYTKYGDWLLWLCLSVTVGFLGKATLKTIGSSRQKLESNLK